MTPPPAPTNGAAECAVNIGMIALDALEQVIGAGASWNAEQIEAAMATAIEGHPLAGKVKLERLFTEDGSLHYQVILPEPQASIEISVFTGVELD